MAEAAVPRAGEPVPAARVVLCPYCGEVSKDATRCDWCRGHFDPLSRQATQNSMGPWFIRNAASPHRPGCSFEVLRGLVGQGKVGPGTVVRGPTTNQFWTPARRAPGIANLLGVCHNCGGPAGPDDVACLTCGATFRYHIDRQHLGLTEVRLLPGQAAPEEIAAATGLEGRAEARFVARPVAPRVSAAAPAAVRADMGPVVGEAGSTGRVPWWVIGLACLAVMGALVAAAWIMDRLPGVRSPILQRVQGGDGAAGDAGWDGQAPVASAGAQSVEPKPESASQAEDVAGGLSSAGVGDAGQGVPADQAGAGEAENLGEVRRLLGTGEEGSLRRAVTLAGGPGGDEEARVLRRAAERLFVQWPMRWLP